MASQEGLAFRKENVGLFELRRSTWELILEQCPPGEVEEIKRVLGTSLVEQVIDLQEEVSVLLEIWRQMKVDTDIECSCNSLLHRTPSLPEPPHVRERLVQEIKFFVNSLQRGSSRPVMSHASSHGRLVEYVNAANLVGLRNEEYGRLREGGCWPHSAVSSRDDGGASLLLQPRLNGQSDESPHSLGDNGLGGVSDHINATSIDKAVKKIQEMLVQDCEQCRSDLQFLQRCMEGEQQDHVNSVKQPEVPALSELREFGSQLEKEYLSETKIRPPPTPLCVRNADDILPSLGRHHLTPLPPKTPRPQQGMMINRASKVIFRDGDGGVIVGSTSARPGVSDVQILGSELTK